MKKVLLLCIIAFTFMACPSDDDMPPAETIQESSIIGTWKFFKSFEDGVEQTLDLCDTEETLIFSANGDFMITFYEEINADCEIDETITGTWSNIGSEYSITTNGETSTETIIFEDNTFYLEYTEVTSPTDPTIVTSREVYIKQ